MLHVSCFLSLFEPTQGFLQSVFEIWQHFQFGLKDFLGLRDVLETGRILLAQLAELSTSKEKLPKACQWKVNTVGEFVLTRYLSAGWDALRN